MRHIGRWAKHRVRRGPRGSVSPVEQIIQAVAWYSEADHFIVLTETETLTKEPQSFAKVDQLIEKGTKMCVWLKRMVSSYNLRTI